VLGPTINREFVMAEQERNLILQHLGNPQTSAFVAYVTFAIDNPELGIIDSQRFQQLLKKKRKNIKRAAKIARLEKEIALLQIYLLQDQRYRTQRG
jgi:hypothetical protein